MKTIAFELSVNETEFASENASNWYYLGSAGKNKYSNTLSFFNVFRHIFLFSETGTKNFALDCKQNDLHFWPLNVPVHFCVVNNTSKFQGFL